MCTTSGYVNAAKAVYYVFANGYDEQIGKQIGIKTGELSEFNSFGDFYFAFIRQWEYLIDCSIAITNDAEKYLSYVNPSMIYCAPIEGSLKNGLDAYQCGIKFNNNAMLNWSFANAVDSLMAVKEFVYDKKEISPTEMKKALDVNWKGYELLQRKVRNSGHKYGNGDRTANLYSAAMAEFFPGKVNNIPNSRGGVYKACFHSARQFIEQGNKTPATPDGRNEGEELSKMHLRQLGWIKTE